MKKLFLMLIMLLAAAPFVFGASGTFYGNYFINASNIFNSTSNTTACFYSTYADGISPQNITLSAQNTQSNNMYTYFIERNYTTDFNYTMLQDCQNTINAITRNFSLERDALLSVFNSLNASINNPLVFNYTYLYDLIECRASKERVMVNRDYCEGDLKNATPFIEKYETCDKNLRESSSSLSTCTNSLSECDTKNTKLEKNKIPGWIIAGLIGAAVAWYILKPKGHIPPEEREFGD